MNWENTDLEDELSAAEEQHLRRLTDAEADGDERVVEAALRPRTLAEVVGQQRVRDQLGLVLEAARQRGRTPDHVLLSGPPGLGKTTLAMIIAAEMSAPLRLTSGPAITHAGDLAAILSGLNEGDVMFVDEIHRMNSSAEEMLYMAMEDFRVDVIIGKGPGATAIPLEIPPFTLVGATTRAGLLPGPLRDRFGFTAHLEFYDPADLDQIDRAVLDVLCRRFGGGPVGVSTLAVAVGEERETVEEVAEPFLVRQGMLARTPRGRVATPTAWQHLGLAVPPGAEAGLFDNT